MLIDNVDQQLLPGLAFYRTVLQGTAPQKGHTAKTEHSGFLIHAGNNLPHKPTAVHCSPEADTSGKHEPLQLLQLQQHQKHLQGQELQQGELDATGSAAAVHAAQLHPSPGYQQAHQHQPRGCTSNTASDGCYSYPPEVQQWAQQDNGHPARLPLHDTSNVVPVLQRPAAYEVAPHKQGTKQQLCQQGQQGNTDLPQRSDATIMQGYGYVEQPRHQQQQKQVSWQHAQLAGQTHRIVQDVSGEFDGQQAPCSHPQQQSALSHNQQPNPGLHPHYGQQHAYQRNRLQQQQWLGSKQQPWHQQHVSVLPGQHHEVQPGQQERQEPGISYNRKVQQGNQYKCVQNRQQVPTEIHKERHPPPPWPQPQQPQHAALPVNSRTRCKQLLQQLSLFEGEQHNDADGKTDSGPNRRWPWLASERKDAQGRSPGSPGYDPSTLHIPATAWSAMTDFNKQFWSIKQKCMDLVLFVRHGSFYNLFDVDADVGLRVGLNISGVMTANMWKVGCHKDYFAVWCAKVLALGYNVGRVEEMPRAAAAGGSKLLTRQLVRIYTPGTAVDGLLADDLDHRANTILCITEVPLRSSSSNTQHYSNTVSNSSSSAGSAIGICVIDVSSGTCKTGVFSTAEDPARSALAAALMIHDPVECVAVRNCLHSATVTLLIRHCEIKGTAQGAGLDSSSGGSGWSKHTPGLTWLPCSSAATVLQQPLQLIQQALPAGTLQQLQAVVASSSSSGGSTCVEGEFSAALLSCVAVAVHLLQRCSLSDDVLPTLEIAALDGLVKPAARTPGAPLFVDDKAITVLDLLASSSSSSGDTVAKTQPRKAMQSSMIAGSRSGNQAGSLLEFLDRAASPGGRRTLQQWICRPLTLVSAIEERLDVLDLFRALPDAATALQQQLAALPDADRLLPKAAAALRNLQQQQQKSDALQQQQQQQQQQQGYQREGVSSTPWPNGSVSDPADSVAVAARKAAWQALVNIPTCLRGLVQSLALLRGAALQKLSNTTQLPLLHRALIAASRASRPVKVLVELLQGAEWFEHEVTADADKHKLSSMTAGCVKLSPGADLSYDAASQQLKQLQQELQEELQQTVAAYSSSNSCIRQVLDTGAEDGVLYLVTQLPNGAVGTQKLPIHGAGGFQQQQFASAAWAQQLLLDDTHSFVHKERLCDSKLAAVVDSSSYVTAANQGAVAAGRGARDRGRGRGTRGRGRSLKPTAAAGQDDDGHLVLHVHIPLLQQLATQVQQAQQQVAKAAAAALDRAATTFLGSYSLFRSLVRAVSELDVLAGFAALMTEGEQQLGCCYFRPRFAAAAAATAGVNETSSGSASPVLRFDGLWHPLLAASSSAGGGGGCVVCNDIHLGGSCPGAMVLTGANMGGKSTLLRSTCIAVIMAQIGCYVPARSALLEPVDAIYTRIGAADAIMCGRSTFMVEMTETAACLTAATPASLIVLDELGRGTSTHDGYALAYAVLKHLVQPQVQLQQQQYSTSQQFSLQRTSAASSTAAASDVAVPNSRKPRLLFATHYHNLTCESELRGLIQSCHMATEWDESAGHLVHVYKLREGAAPAGSCGIEVAALAGLPSSVVQRATQMAAVMQGRYMIQ